MIDGLNLVVPARGGRCRVGCVTCLGPSYRYCSVMGKDEGISQL